MSSSTRVGFLREVLNNNIEGVVVFVERLLWHDGKVNVKYLYRMKEQGDKFHLESISESDKPSDLCILMGGEVPNSFCPLYEITYFFQAWFLSAIGTIFVNRYGLLKGKDSIFQKDFRQQIRREALALSEEEIWEALAFPKVSIICSLDTDIEPYRYVKHQLWRLADSALKKRCSYVTKEEMAYTAPDNTLKDIYWIEQDREIAEIAMANAENLSRAKAIQYYLTLKEFLGHWPVDLSNVPLYFNFVPREEWLELGPDNEIFSTLVALHEKNFIKILSKLTRQQQPWIITTACPNCGETSKRIISSHLKGNGKTVRAKCSSQVKEFRNEAGIIVARQGCGHSFEFQVPDNPKDLYQFCQQNDFTVNFAVRELVIVLKTTADSPVCWPVTEIGVRRQKNQNGIYALTTLPRGYGDHLSLLTSMLVIQKLFVEGIIVPPLSQKLREQGVLTAKEMLLIANVSESTLEDREVIADSGTVYVKDTSALKALHKGLQVEEFFKRSIDLYPFSTEDLMKLRNLNWEEIVSLAKRS